MQEKFSLIPKVIIERGEISTGVSSLPTGQKDPKGSRRTVLKQKSKSWKKTGRSKRWDSGRKRASTKKRVLTPGKVDPKAGQKKQYNHSDLGGRWGGGVVKRGKKGAPAPKPQPENQK